MSEFATFMSFKPTTHHANLMEPTKDFLGAHNLPIETFDFKDGLGRLTPGAGRALDHTMRKPGCSVISLKLRYSSMLVLRTLNDYL